MNVGLIVAAGKGERFGGGNKQLAPVAGRPVLAHSLAAFLAAGLVDMLVVVAPAGEKDRFLKEAIEPLGQTKPLALVEGAPTRQGSVAAGLDACPPETELVWVHDGARPLITPELIDLMARKLGSYDGLILASPAVDTLKLVEGELIRETVPRERIWLAQTPQLFRYRDLREAHRAADEGLNLTDDSALVERQGGRVAVLPNDLPNLKVTTGLDLEVADRIMKQRLEAPTDD
jgi:2-C-methyl-D-erythritol 4-phosphate cytidylyltransferase